MEHLEGHYLFERGSSAKGIDLPDPHILTDIKVTSKRQPQSSCPYRDSKQKIFGLGYNLLVFVYDKVDDHATRSARLEIVHCNFLDKERTSDYTITLRLREMLKDGANTEEIASYLSDRSIPGDEVTLRQLAETILASSVTQGYLTISNALQWRLQYGRVVNLQEKVAGISKLI